MSKSFVEVGDIQLSRKIITKNSKKILDNESIIPSNMQKYMINQSKLFTEKVAGLYKIEKSFIGYKKITCSDGKIKFDVIAKLEIPVNAIVVRAMDKTTHSGTEASNKLRTTKALVKYIEYPNGYGPTNSNCFSIYDPFYYYSLGKECIPKKVFDFTIDTSIASGIHFYLTKKETELI